MLEFIKLFSSTAYNVHFLMPSGWLTLINLINCVLFLKLTFRKVFNDWITNLWKWGLWKQLNLIVSPCFIPFIYSLHYVCTRLIICDRLLSIPYLNRFEISNDAICKFKMNNVLTLFLQYVKGTLMQIWKSPYMFLFI